MVAWALRALTKENKVAVLSPILLKALSFDRAFLADASSSSVADCISHTVQASFSYHAMRHI